MMRERLPEHEDRCEARTDGRRCQAVSSLEYRANGERLRLCALHWSDFIARSTELRGDRGWGYCLAAVTAIRELKGQASPTLAAPVSMNL